MNWEGIIAAFLALSAGIVMLSLAFMMIGCTFLVYCA